MDSIAERILLAVMLVTAFFMALWMAGAIYYDVGRATKWGRLLALGWLIGVITLFALWQPLWQPFAVLLGVLAVFLVWWFRQKPSHDREWEPGVARMPRAVRDGDVVTIENIRNFDYRSLTDFTPHYERRVFHLSNLRAADIIFFTWGAPCMSHPVLVFDFGPDGRICGSIEVRYRKGQKFSTFRSFYRQQELIFLVADERDVILRRTKCTHNHKAHLYRFNAGVEELRTVFLDYVGAINELYERPRWYHGLWANCTTSFYRLPHSKVRFDWRVLANGRLDWALYKAGRLDRTLPFPELQRLAYLNDIANSAPEDGFGEYIRRELERRRHEEG
jgi:hypothetical protein